MGKAQCHGGDGCINPLDQIPERVTYSRPMAHCRTKPADPTSTILDLHPLYHRIRFRVRTVVAKGALSHSSCGTVPSRKNDRPQE